MVTGSFPGVKRRRGMTTPQLHLETWSRKNILTPLFPLRAVQPVQSINACTTVNFSFTYTSNLAMDRTACTKPKCLYNGALYLYLYLYNSYRLYSLYRASVPVQRCTLTLPITLPPYGSNSLYRASVPVQRWNLHLHIPLFSLWTVQPVRSLSACTTVHFTFTYNSTPLWIVQPVQSLSACTTVHFIFTYTSSPPGGCTACTEPQ